MIIAASVALLLLLWLCCEAYGMGWWNTIDTLAWHLHRYCKRGRRMHAERTARVGERWIRALEAGDEHADA